MPQRHLPKLFIFDLMLSLASLAYGGWTANSWFIAGGLLGLLIAWLKPAQRLARYAERKAQARRMAAAPDEHIAVDAAAGAEPEQRPHFGRNPPPYVAARAMRNRHNLLRNNPAERNFAGLAARYWS